MEVLTLQELKVILPLEKYSLPILALVIMIL